jgi:hypothetical protein
LLEALCGFDTRKTALKLGQRKQAFSQAKKMAASLGRPPFKYIFILPI